jgi:ParB family transcriptional regulator, chromosome partitioning protein
MEKRRGLGSLIPTERWLPKEEGSIRISVDKIRSNRYQPRQTWDEEKLAELADSIRQHGVIQPLTVRAAGDGYELIAGERRFEASKRAGLKDVPAIIRTCSDKEMLELALVENLQREDLNPIESAEAYRRLHDEFELTQEQVSERVGKSRQAVANTLRLLDLPDFIQDSLKQGKLSEGHAKVLLSIQEPSWQRAVWSRAMRGGLSVRQMERLAKVGGNVPRGTKLSGVNSELMTFLRPLQEKMMHKLGTKVTISSDGKGGKIEIIYADEDEFERIYNLILD